MSKLLSMILTIGGVSVAVVFAVALVWVEVFARPPEGIESGAPEALYWVLLVVGVVAAIAGFVLDRRKASSAS